MAVTNTITNKTAITNLALNDPLGVDDTNDLDIFGSPITKKVTALQIAQYIYRAFEFFGAAYTKTDCVVATDTALVGTYSNGTLGVGATFTITATGALVIDGRTMAVADRVLLWKQASIFQNGIYTVTNAGDVGVSPILTRATDYDTSAEILLGTNVSITGGSTLIGGMFVMYNPNTITVGTTSVLFKYLGAVIVGGTNAFTVTGTGLLAPVIGADAFPIFPAGSYTVITSGNDAALGNITCSNIVFSNSSAFGTSTSAGNTFTIKVYDVDGAAYKIFGTGTANNTPTLDLSPPSGGLLTISKSVGTGATTIIPSGSLSVNTTGVNNVTTGETTLMTYDLPANTLVTTGQMVEHEIRGVFASSANAKTLKIYFGGTVVLSNSLPINTAGAFWGKFSYQRTGSSAQNWNFIFMRTVTAATGTAPPVVTSGTCTETETAAITMKVTGTGGASDEIGQKFSSINNYAG